MSVTFLIFLYFFLFLYIFITCILCLCGPLILLQMIYLSSGMSPPGPVRSCPLVEFVILSGNMPAYGFKESKGDEPQAPPDHSQLPFLCYHLRSELPFRSLGKHIDRGGFQVLMSPLQGLVGKHGREKVQGRRGPLFSPEPHPARVLQP